jgi:cobalt-zinc-cadmium efflux system outer membrane protein
MTQRLARAVLSLAVLWAPGGCAGSRDASYSPEPRPLGADLPAFHAPERPGNGPQPSPPIEEPAGDLTLGEALALTLIRNPELAAFSWEVRAQEARALQAGLRPNPALALEVENVAGSGHASGFGNAETTISLSQLLELSGKRGKRQRLAELDRDLAAWDYETVRLELLTAVTRTFVGLLAAQERLRLAEDLVQVAEEALADVSRRVRAGAVSPVEETRARVELSTSRLDRLAAQQECNAVRVRLAASWGGGAPRFARAVGTLEPLAPPPALEHLLDRIDQNPDIARGKAERAQREADLGLQRALGTSDIEVEGGVRRMGESSEHAFVVGLALPLPVFDRNQGSRREAEIRVARAGEEHRARTVRARSNLVVAHGSLIAAYEEITVLETAILPDAESALVTAREAHRKGLFGFTDFLDTQRTLFELRGRRFDALARYHRAVADIERLIGEPLSGIGGSDAKN